MDILLDGKTASPRDKTLYFLNDSNLYKNLTVVQNWPENWCSCNITYTLSISENDIALATSFFFTIAGHVTNCCQWSSMFYHSPICLEESYKVLSPFCTYVFFGTCTNYLTVCSHCFLPPKVWNDAPVIRFATGSAGPGAVETFVCDTAISEMSL